MRGQVLLFHFTDEKRLSAVRKALLPVQVLCKVMSAEDETKPIGSFLGLPTQPQEQPAPAEITEEVMVLCGMSESTLSSVVVTLRKAGLVIPYKASLTPTNKDWTPEQLFGEIKEEHEYMKKMNAPKHEQS